MIQATDMPKPGTRIEVVEMTNPLPLPAGSRGTVRGFSWHPLGEHSWAKIRVAWDDSGRPLDLIVPPDRFRLVDNEQPPDELRELLTRGTLVHIHFRN